MQVIHMLSTGVQGYARPGPIVKRGSPGKSTLGCDGENVFLISLISYRWLSDPASFPYSCPGEERQMTLQRKALGKRGECLLDGYFQGLGWKTVAANLRVRNGEIDRVYASCVLPKEFCVAEVKTLRIRGVDHLRSILGGDFLRRALNSSQCRNLHRHAQLLWVPGVRRVHIRVFRLFAFRDAYGAAEALRLLQERFGVSARTGGARILRVDERTVGMAVTPEFVPRGGRTCELQVEV
jgi:Holliday junction resolvase-like predicted endonuclease